MAPTRWRVYKTGCQEKDRRGTVHGRTRNQDRSCDSCSYRITCSCKRPTSFRLCLFLKLSSRYCFHIWLTEWRCINCRIHLISNLHEYERSICSLFLQSHGETDGGICLGLHNSPRQITQESSTMKRSEPIINEFVDWVLANKTLAWISSVGISTANFLVVHSRMADQLTVRSTVRRELTVSQSVKKFLAFCRIRRLNAMFLRANL